MKRYSVDGTDGYMTEDCLGDYVSFADAKEDHDQAIAEKDARIALLEAELVAARLPLEHADNYVKQLEADRNKLVWLVRHAIFCASISRAKGAELLGVPLIDLDAELSALTLKDKGEV